MRDFKDKVAVITGAASGIGRALADRCAREGMRLVLADIEPEALAEAEQELAAQGARVVSRPTDVSKAADIQALAELAYAQFGAVDLLFNNAGVTTVDLIWESPLADCEWLLGVNLWGVLHGIRVFVPRMLAQGTPGHIVNTASMAGLTSGVGLGVYGVTKHAVVCASETLLFDLRQRGAAIGVSLLCPAWVNTRIMEAARNRPTAAGQEEVERNPEAESIAEMIHQFVENGLSPEAVADLTFDAIREDRFYIYTHPDWLPLVERRMQDILAGRNPA
jgi:NAD(P)-dependent dehydrogenase (short-subunit alcohol dehydrogenase family)